MFQPPLLAWLYWNPPRYAFTIPYLDLPVAWYGILFAVGFVIGYFILIPIARQTLFPGNDLEARAHSVRFVDQLTWYIVIGTVVGARLGHVLFYDLPYYQENPLDILMIRKGGLASHGATIGILIGLFLFLHWNRKQFPKLTFVGLIDMLVIPTAFCAFCIRIGNFMNQEILGHTTTVPWAIIFGNSADGTLPAPRHPVQLYEAGSYILTFIVLMVIWRFRWTSLKTGTLSGLFFIAVFGSRFLIDFFKEPQSLLIDESSIQMGQLLSIPFILFGILLLCLKPNKHLA